VKLIYTPGDGDRQEFVYTPGKIRTAEAEMLERRTGMTWGDFNQALARGSILARRALLWHFLRKVHHTLRFEDVDFALDELSLEFDKEELGRLRKSIEETRMPPGTPDGMLETILSEVDKQIEEAEEAPGKAS
jgi:hypothetical protein